MFKEILMIEGASFMAAELVKAFFIGLIQGITEWLPVSSTGHMLLFDRAFRLSLGERELVLFLTLIQLFSALAVVILGFRDIFPFLVRGSGKKGVRAGLLLWAKIAVGSLPLAVIGLIFNDAIDALVTGEAATFVIAGALIFYGIGFIAAELARAKKADRVTSFDRIGFGDALLIGCFQSLAIVPGTSRSGATILGARLLGISRPAAATFSFYLSVPAMVGAGGLKIARYLSVGEGAPDSQSIIIMLLGCAVSFGVSMLAVEFLRGFVKKHSFIPFGIYRIVLGSVVLAVGLFS